MTDADFKYTTAENAVHFIKTGNRVFVHGSAATPLRLLNAMLERAGEIHDVEIISISTMGAINWDRPEVKKSFRLNSLFVSANVREWVDCTSGDYVPVFLSEIPRMFEQGVLAPDVALIQVSPPDRHGYCTLGTSVDAALSAVRIAGTIIAQVNPLMPRTHGDGHIHFSRFTAAIWDETPLPEVFYGSRTDERTEQVGRNVAALIENGSTLQMGIGAIPDAVLRFLGNHKKLGVHTEMFSDGIMNLVENNIVTNEYKKIGRGKIVTSFVSGTRKLYDFVDDNPGVAFMDVAYVNDPAVIRQNPKVVSINSAIEIDMTGQVCADSIGIYQYSGIGGQMDFMQGSSLSEGGKPIIAMPSVTNKGVSRIVPFLNTGAGVVTTRGHVHFVVTEYGAVNLYGKNLEQRAKLLISIAHPDHREMLERACYSRFVK